jgi:hypothetical protein
MTKILKEIDKEIDKVRKKLNKEPANLPLMKKSFASGMYLFSMFMISYYQRVRENLQLDFDSFMIIQTVVSHNLYHLNKTKSNNYSELTSFWDEITKVSLFQKTLELISDVQDEILKKKTIKYKNKLSISSICLVVGLPKETVRRKVNKLQSKNLLKISKNEGILLGTEYKLIFKNFVPQTLLEVSKLLKNWEKNGVLENLLNFKI